MNTILTTLGFLVTALNSTHMPAVQGSVADHRSPKKVIVHVSPDPGGSDGCSSTKVVLPYDSDGPLSFRAD